MSVALYVKEANLGIQRKIKKLLDYANARPYPKDAIAAVRKNKKKYKGKQLAISQLLSIYSEEGQLVNDLSTVDDETIRIIKEVAELISPGLWQRLQDSQLGLAKRDEVTYLSDLNPENEIREAYQKFYAVLSSSDSKKSQAAKKLFDESPPDLFYEKLKIECGLDLALNSFGADGLVQAAFRDIFIEKKEVAKPAPIEKVSTTQASSSGTINENKPPVSTQTASNTSVKSEGTINESKPGTSEKPSTSSKSEGAINEKTSTTVDKTAITNTEGSVTSKKSELQSENVLPINSTQAVNINLENKPVDPITSTSSTNTSSTNTQNTTNNTSNILNGKSKKDKGKPLLKLKDGVEKTSESSGVNEEKKEKGGFLSIVGNLAKKAGSALNIASVGELRDAAGGFFGATGANVKSRVDEITESFKNTSINSQKNTSTSTDNSKKNTTVLKSEDNSKKNTTVLNTPTALDQTSNVSNLSSDNQSIIKVEQSKPSVSVAAPTSLNTQNNSSNTSESTNILKNNGTSSSNTSNSAASSNTTTSNNIPNTTASDNSKPGGVYVDMSQVTQAVARLERVILSGIEVTIKDA